MSLLYSCCVVLCGWWRGIAKFTRLRLGYFGVYPTGSTSRAGSGSTLVGSGYPRVLELSPILENPRGDGSGDNFAVTPHPESNESVA